MRIYSKIPVAKFWKIFSLPNNLEELMINGYKPCLILYQIKFYYTDVDKCKISVMLRRCLRFILGNHYYQYNNWFILKI